MRDYQRTKNNKYYLPKAVYNQTLWLIRDYERMSQELDEMLLASAPPREGMPSSGKRVNEVEMKAEQRDEYRKKTLAIESCLMKIPEEYRVGVWQNIMEWKSFPLDADRTTYARWKSKFICDVATSLGLIRSSEIG